jgi:hypothetical protein
MSEEPREEINHQKINKREIAIQKQMVMNRAVYSQRKEICERTYHSSKNENIANDIKTH